jgi:hypothetical protein
MTAAALLARTREAGLTLTAHGDRLRWRGPQPAADLLHDLASCKAEVLRLLAAEAAPNTPDVLAATAVASGPVRERRPSPKAPEDVPNAWGLTETERAALLARLQQRATPNDSLDGLRRAALQRPPSWVDPAARPSPGCCCSCCRGQRWWRERAAPKAGAVGPVIRRIICHPMR